MLERVELTGLLVAYWMLKTGGRKVKVCELVNTHGVRSEPVRVCDVAHILADLWRTLGVEVLDGAGRVIPGCTLMAERLEAAGYLLWSLRCWCDAGLDHGARPASRPVGESRDQDRAYWWDVKRVIELADRDAVEAGEVLGLSSGTVRHSLACLERWTGIEWLKVFNAGRGLRWWVPTDVTQKWLGLGRGRVVTGLLAALCDAMDALGESVAVMGESENLDRHRGDGFHHSRSVTI